MQGVECFSARAANPGGRSGPAVWRGLLRCAAHPASVRLWTEERSVVIERFAAAVPGGRFGERGKGGQRLLDPLGARGAGVLVARVDLGADGPVGEAVDRCTAFDQGGCGPGAGTDLPGGLGHM